MMPRSAIALGLCTLATALVLGGCGSPRSRFYTLATVPAEPIADAGRAPVIGLASLELPPELERRTIVTSRDGALLEVHGGERWAAPFEAMVHRTLALDLAERLGSERVVLPGQATPRSGLTQIAVVIVDFAADATGTVHLNAIWSRLTPTGEHQSQRVEIEHPAGATSLPAIATAMSEALGQLADALATSLVAGGEGGR